VVPADDAGALDPHDVETGRHVDGAGSTVLDPGLWPELHRLALVEGPQDVLDDDVCPVEERVVPGDVVGVHSPGTGHGHAQSLGEGGLATATASVDRDQSWASGDAG
jgi:hypothetical protein